MSIVKVEKTSYTVEPFYQWDRNRVLEIRGLSLPRAPEVHFYNTTMDRAIARQATMDSAGVITVSVPNGLLQKPYTITAHLCFYTGATFETQYTLKLPVTPRTQPADYTIEDDGDVYSFNELENKVNNAVAALAETNERIDALIGESTGSALMAWLDATLSTEGKAAEAKAVGDALAALDALLTPVVLWENEDTTVAFEAKTIPLNLADYKRFCVVLKAGLSKDYLSAHTLPEKDSTFLCIASHDSNGAARHIKATDTGLEIGANVYMSGSAQTNSNGAIPVKVIGYKY